MHNFLLSFQATHVLFIYLMDIYHQSHVKYCDRHLDYTNERNWKSSLPVGTYILVEEMDNKQ